MTDCTHTFDGSCLSEHYGTRPRGELSVCYLYKTIEQYNYIKLPLKSITVDQRVIELLTDVIYDYQLELASYN